MTDRTGGKWVDRQKQVTVAMVVALYLYRLSSLASNLSALRLSANNLSLRVGSSLIRSSLAESSLHYGPKLYEIDALNS